MREPLTLTRPKPMNISTMSYLPVIGADSNGRRNTSLRD
jgi:hypothetical protein